MRRAKSDAALLTTCRSSLGRDAHAATAARIREIAHGLAGAAGLFGFDQISSDAAALEEAVVARLAGERSAEDLTLALDRLVSRLEGEWDAPWPQRAQSAQA